MAKFTPGPWTMGAISVIDLASGMAQDADDEAVILSDSSEANEDFEIRVNGPNARNDARLIANAPAMHNRLTAAFHALRSYQHRNGSPDLAKALADDIERLLAQIEAS